MKFKETSRDEFSNAFEVFKSGQLLRIDELRNKFLNPPNFQRRNLSGTSSTDPCYDALCAHQIFAKELGESFLNNFEEIIFKNCEKISNQDVQVLQQEMRQIFLALLEQAKNSLARLATSLGRQNDIKSIHLPLENYYIATLSKYSKILESRTAQFNLESERKKKTAPSSVDSMIKWLKNHSPWSYIIMFGMIIIALAAFMSAIREIVTTIKTISPTPAPAISFSESDFTREANVRFGFSYLYPSKWDRGHSPDNSDGSSFAAPKQHGVKITMWGSYAVVSETLNDYVAFVLSDVQRKPGFRLILDRESGRYLIDWEEVGGRVLETKEQIEGWRLVYEFSEDGRKNIAMEALTQFNGKQFTILCQAPSDVFPAYEDLFLKLVTNLHVLSEQSIGQGPSQKN